MCKEFVCPSLFKFTSSLIRVDNRRGPADGRRRADASRVRECLLRSPEFLASFSPISSLFPWHKHSTHPRRTKARSSRSCDRGSKRTAAPAPAQRLSTFSRSLQALANMQHSSAPTYPVCFGSPPSPSKRCKRRSWRGAPTPVFPRWRARPARPKASRFHRWFSTCSLLPPTPRRFLCPRHTRTATRT